MRSRVPGILEPRARGNANFSKERGNTEGKRIGTLILRSCGHSDITTPTTFTTPTTLTTFTTKEYIYSLLTTLPNLPLLSPQPSHCPPDWNAGLLAVNPVRVPGEGGRGCLSVTSHPLSHLDRSHVWWGGGGCWLPPFPCQQ